MRGKYLIGTTLVLMLGIFAFAGWSENSLGGKRTAGSSLSPLVTPTLGPVRDIIITKGTVAYNHQIILRSQFRGQVERLSIKEGNEVVHGQHLLRIATRQEEIDFELHNLELERGQTNLSAIDKELLAIRRLVEVGGLPQHDLDQKILERDMADKELQRVRLKISRLKQTVELSNLKSPVNGVVLSVHVETGQPVNAGDELVSLTGGVGPYIIAFVDVMDVGRISIDQSVIFSENEESGMRRKGRVKEISRAVGGTQRPNSVKVVVEPIESIRDLRISQQLYVEFIVREEAAVIRIPREMIYIDGDRQVVYVLTEQGVIARPVQTQSGDLSFAKVISGVDLTDRLVHKPQHATSSP